MAQEVSFFSILGKINQQSENNEHLPPFDDGALAVGLVDLFKFQKPF